MLLEIKQLDISYDGSAVPTVSDVSISLDSGKVLAIVGESGSGKTTVIRAVLGVLSGTGAISGGEIIFDGKDLVKNTPAEWGQIRGTAISMIFQDSGNMLNPVHTIGKQFLEYIRTHSDMSEKEAYERATALLARTNLPNPENIMKSYTFELSGGMRQRVGIAMSLAFHPKLLLADEPTSALDVTTQAQIIEELMGVVKEANVAMIIVTHNIGVAHYVADDIMVMKSGRVVEYGDADTVVMNPQHNYTKELLASIPSIKGESYVRAS